MLSNAKTHYSQLTTHSSSLIVASVAVPRPSDGIKGMLFDSTGSRARGYSSFGDCVLQTPHLQNER